MVFFGISYAQKEVYRAQVDLLRKAHPEVIISGDKDGKYYLKYVDSDGINISFANSFHEAEGFAKALRATGAHVELRVRSCNYDDIPW